MAAAAAAAVRLRCGTLLCGHLDGDAYTIPPPGSLWLACLGAVLVQEQESPLRRSTMAPVGVGCVLRLACRHDGSRCGARGLREKRRIVSPIRSPRRVSRATFTGYARSAWFFRGNRGVLGRSSVFCVVLAVCVRGETIAPIKEACIRPPR